MSSMLIDHAPAFCLRELDGKTLTMSVGEDYNVETGLRYTTVIGTDENGHSYVIVDKREPIDVHPK